MNKVKNREYIWVYVYRRTIEKDYEGEEYLARLNVKTKWFKKYVTEKYDGERDPYMWESNYSADDTIDLYEKAKKAKAIRKIEFTKPVVIEDPMDRSQLTLGFDAARMLEIIGKNKEAQRVIDTYAFTNVKYSYNTIRKRISKKIPVIRKKEEAMVKEVCAINVYSELNTVIDFIVVVCREDLEHAKEIISMAYDEWFEDMDAAGDSTISGYIELKLKDAGIEFEVFYKDRETGHELLDND